MRQYPESCSKALGRSQVAQGCLVAVGAGRVGGRKNSIATVGLLVDGDVVR